MSLKLINGDAFDEIKKLKNVDAVICDPPYDGSFPHRRLRKICDGNMVAFCMPENQWTGGDEYLFWLKTPSTKNFKNKCGRFVEVIVVYRDGKTFNQLHWSQMIGVYDDRHISATAHPYQKPLSLMQRLIRIYTKPGDTILDPFMGSGTTGVAAIGLGRNFIGIEKDSVYFNLAKKRLKGLVNLDG
jgi:DNA modification methylase